MDDQFIEMCIVQEAHGNIDTMRRRTPFIALLDVSSMTVFLYANKALWGVQNRGALDLITTGLHVSWWEVGGWGIAGRAYIARGGEIGMGCHPEFFGHQVSTSILHWIWYQGHTGRPSQKHQPYIFSGNTGLGFQLVAVAGCKATPLLPTTPVAPVNLNPSYVFPENT